MGREAVRQMKHVLKAGLRPDASPAEVTIAKESALSLLNRSIAFGHERLAVVRLAMAVRVGADVPAACWDYCRRAAEASKDPSLQKIFVVAAQEASHRSRQAAVRGD
jgi:hypothetical protein